MIDTWDSCAIGTSCTRCADGCRCRTAPHDRLARRSCRSRSRSLCGAALSRATRRAVHGSCRRSGGTRPPLPACAASLTQRSEMRWRRGLRGDDGRSRQQVQRTGGGADLAGGDPKIAGRGGQASVSQQKLDGADIGTGFQQVDGEGVAQRMRRDRLADARDPSRRLAGALNRKSRDGPPGLIARKQPVRRMGEPPIVAQGVEQLRR